MALDLRKPGQTAARFARTLAVGRGSPAEACAYAEGRNEWSNVVTALRAMVDPVSTAEAASMMRPVATDFCEYLRPLTILGRLQGLRRAPFDTRMVRISEGAAAAWAGEGAPVPVSSVELEAQGTTLPRAKCTGIAVVSEELVLSSNPAAEATLLADLGAATAREIDHAFIDPSNGGGDEKPASVTHGATSFESSGTALAEIDADLGKLIGTLTASGSDLSAAHWVMRPSTALHIASLRGTGGALAHPTLNVRGGMLLGLPVLISANVPMVVGSPTTTSIILLDADGVLVADDGEAEFEAARHASLQMDTAPSDGAQQLVSMWQLGLAALRAQRWTNWRARREGIAAVLSGVTY